MTTRFWLTSSAATYTPTTIRGTWNSTTTTSKLLDRQPGGTATTVSVAETSASTTNVLMMRWITPPARKAGTLAGTVSWIFGRMQSTSTAAMKVRAHIFVTSGSTDTVRGTLLSNYTGTTVYPTTAAGGGESNIALSSVAVQVGDRIVIEFGYQATNTSTTSMSATMNYGGTGTTDLASGSTAVTTNPGWVDFSGADALFAPAIGEITDTFDTGINTNVWSVYGGVTWLSATQRVSIPGDTSFPGLETNSNSYEITGSSLLVQVAKMPAGGSGTDFEMYVAGTTQGTFIQFLYLVSGGTLSFQNRVNDVDNSPVTITYDPLAHQWLRFRESGGTLYWETSPDTSTWTVQRSLATPQWLKTASVYPGRGVYSDTTTSGSAEIDNVNAAPPAAPAGRPVKVWSGSAWVQKPVKVWSGSAWVQKPVKVWSGSAWS